MLVADVQTRMAPSRNTRVRKLPATPLQAPANRQNTSTVATRRYLFSVGFTARRATSAEVSKASRLTLFLQANRPDLPAEVSKASYLYSEVFDLKPTSGLYLKNSAHLSNFLTPRTVSAIGADRRRIFCGVLFFRWFPAKTCAKERECLLPN